MKTTVTKSEFIHAFDKMNRSNNFSYEGRAVLYDFLTELEEETGQEQELDVIAFCVDFTEYSSLEEFQQDHGEEYESFEDIQNETMFIPIDGESFIIQQF
jgi:hypothetical protein